MVPAIEVEALVKTFNRGRKNAVHALQGISFSVWPGEVVGLLGPNGAGKTTTIKCILGLISPTGGTTRVYGFDTRTHRREVVRRTSAVLEGSRNIYWRMSALENLDFFTGLYGMSLSESRPYSEKLLELFRLRDRKHVPVQELSAGMRQKVAVACALATRTPVVFLDEPTLGLDVETSYELRRSLKQLAEEENRTIILSSHDMHVVQDVCQRVIIMNQGRIVVDDTVDNLLSLFRTRAYRFVLSDGLREDLERQLRARFPEVVVRRDLQTVVEVVVSRPEEIYLLIDLFREAGLLIESITQQEPDLEEAFLRLVRGEVAC